ncbi:hypothetical protein HAALTHF_15500n [Vreelandella aquamarina]|nr:hypothetical protein HAALTHF_15500n [Halomonas axialensis]
MIEGLTEQALYAPIKWQDASQEYQDILYHTAEEGIARITINRPEVRNAFRPQTVSEMIHALGRARHDSAIGAILLTGAGDQAFAPGATSAFVATTAATATRRAPITSTCWISSVTFAPAPNLSSPWWRATPLAVATCCT